MMKSAKQALGTHYCPERNDLYVSIETLKVQMAAPLVFIFHRMLRTLESMANLAGFIPCYQNSTAGYSASISA